MKDNWLSIYWPASPAWTTLDTLTYVSDFSSGLKCLLLGVFYQADRQDREQAPEEEGTRGAGNTDKCFASSKDTH